MHFIDRLARIQQKKKTLLCVGIDPEIEKLPTMNASGEEALFLFSKNIIEACAPYAAAIKINFAFFERHGENGWRMLRDLRAAIPEDCIALADAKRGDIGNSAKHYAHAVLEDLNYDAITVSPYMGADSVAPFIQNPSKGAFMLCLTSNPGADDFQFQMSDGRPLYAHVAERVSDWNSNQNCGLVTGATRPEYLAEIRGLAPKLPLLIPGVGAQGGDLNEVLKAVGDANVLISASRSIIYASQNNNYASAAGEQAELMQKAMAPYFNS